MMDGDVLALSVSITRTPITMVSEAYGWTSSLGTKVYHTVHTGYAV
jgi:hypothetical protein